MTLPLDLLPTVTKADANGASGPTGPTAQPAPPPRPPASEPRTGPPEDEGHQASERRSQIGQKEPRSVRMNNVMSAIDAMRSTVDKGGLLIEAEVYLDEDLNGQCVGIRLAFPDDVLFVHAEGSDDSIRVSCAFPAILLDKSIHSFGARTPRMAFGAWTSCPVGMGNDQYPGEGGWGADRIWYRGSSVNHSADAGSGLKARGAGVVRAPRERQ